MNACYMKVSNFIINRTPFLFHKFSFFKLNFNDSKTVKLKTKNQTKMVEI